jgi:hypothetical protein
VIASSIGITIFLLGVLFVSQITAHLSAEARLRADVDHAARVVASADIQRRGPAAVEAALALERQRLTGIYRRGAPRLTWTVAPDGSVLLDVRAASPARLLAAAAQVLGIDEIHATARVRAEHSR